MSNESTNTIKDEETQMTTPEVIEWPTKPSHLAELGVLGMSQSVQPDCPRCPLTGVCPGYNILRNPSPPCKTYTSYTEWEQNIIIKGADNV